MTEQGMTEAEAFRHIQRTAMNERTSMKALAQTILADDGAAEGSPPDRVTRCDLSGATRCNAVSHARRSRPHHGRSRSGCICSGGS